MTNSNQKFNLLEILLKHKAELIKTAELKENQNVHLSEILDISMPKNYSLPNYPINIQIGNLKLANKQGLANICNDLENNKMCTDNLNSMFPDFAAVHLSMLSNTIYKNYTNNQIFIIESTNSSNVEFSVLNYTRLKFELENLVSLNIRNTLQPINQIIDNTQPIQFQINDKNYVNQNQLEKLFNNLYMVSEKAANMQPSTEFDNHLKNVKKLKNKVKNLDNNKFYQLMSKADEDTGSNNTMVQKIYNYQAAKL